MTLIRKLAVLSGAAAAVLIAWGWAMAASTPIEHVVVIFQENVSFDHYFATYPHALGRDGNPFTAAPDTPSVNGLTPELMTANPNFNGKIGNPFRLAFAQAATCDQDHNYTAEQKAYDNGLLDMFPEFTNIGDCVQASLSAGHPLDLVMGYYDGNTVTALWNYAQHFALNDNSFGTTYGPSTPGAINLVSGNTSGAWQDAGRRDITGGSVIRDAQPTGDACTTRDSVHLTGANIGDLLNKARLTWGWFEGGFDLSIINPNGTTCCKRSHASITGAFKAVTDYIPHHEAFQFYASTANPAHRRPSSVGSIGSTNDGGANHQYDCHDFFDALRAGNLAAVAFLKAPAYEDAHAGYSTPRDEQVFIANTINRIEESKFWDSTAVIIEYDDSDGWYDHQMGPTIMHSQQAGDALTAPGMCGGSANALQGQGRCGYGPRLPYLVVSPWAKTNFVDHTLTDQTSTIAFIEQNWGLGHIPGSADQYAGPIANMFDFTRKKSEVAKHKLFIDPTTGEVLDKAPEPSASDAAPGSCFSAPAPAAALIRVDFPPGRSH